MRFGALLDEGLGLWLQARGEEGGCHGWLVTKCLVCLCALLGFGGVQESLLPAREKVGW